MNSLEISSQPHQEGTELPLKSSKENQNSSLGLFLLFPSLILLDQDQDTIYHDNSPPSDKQQNTEVQKPLEKKKITLNVNKKPQEELTPPADSPYQLFNFFRTGSDVISGSPTGLTINAKDDMESPTFCQKAEPGLSPVFKMSVQNMQSSIHKETSFERSEASPKQEDKINISNELMNESPKESSKERKNRKIVNMLEEYKNKKMQSKPSLNLMNSITTIQEGTVRSKGFMNASESIFF